LLKQRIAQWVSIGMVAALACPAYSWGPETERSVVSSAGHVFSRGSSIPLVKLNDYITQGSAISDAEDKELFLQFDIDPVRTIQREMFLLQGVKAERIDPYYAYRLGALGTKIVQLSAPMRNVDTSIQEQYYTDVESMISGVRLQSARRNIVEPQLYFNRLQQQASDNNSAIMVDYRSGLGINGIAGGLLQKDASRAVNAVSDVWYTIFSAQLSDLNVSKTDMREYMLASIDFYLKNDNIAEVNDVYSRAKSKRILTKDMTHTIGDLYYDNGFFTEALNVYEELLESDPGLREVKKRIAEYYVSVGDIALAKENHEAALDAYTLAVESDVLHPEAQRKMVLTNRSIEKRVQRLTNTQTLLEIAARSELESEESGLRRDYAQAIQYLRTAEVNYREVTQEFPDLTRQANLGLRGVQIKMKTLKTALVEDAQRLSGSGFPFEAKLLAGEVPETSNDAMTAALRADYRSALEQLAGDITIP
jgi:tetratricopeptide (TPR) repeat protein